jgi:SAM-dependent methyltransferase
MLGTRETFTYSKCEACGCLSLNQQPDNIAEYYPNTYYSLRADCVSVGKRIRSRLYLSPLSFLVNWRRRTDLDVMRAIGLQKGMKLLDVGCGRGHLIAELRTLGYTACGVDPFVSENIYDAFGLRVERKTLADVHDRYDVILFRHSLEHMPIDSLKIGRDCLKSNGVCVVCIPLVGWAWERYGVNWAQLDAPRHLFLHTQESFRLLAEKSGFKVERVVFDSSQFQFWASEAYRRNISLAQASRPNIFGMARLRRRARLLNESERGDSAQFYLRARIE